VTDRLLKVKTAHPKRDKQKPVVFIIYKMSILNS
jgi:hypothetical protein